MSFLEIAAILFLVACAWFWLDSLRARETAVRAARAACASEGLLLLDDTVAISGLKLTRNQHGRIQLQRAYDFEYSDNGDNRLAGNLVLLGHQVIMVNVGVQELADAENAVVIDVDATLDAILTADDA